jgi:SAM-dependent methyltransferase
MNSFSAYGRTTHGFELNPYCHDYAKNHLQLQCTLGKFDDDHVGRYDLIAAVMVFEHLENPRDLFRTMASKLNPDGAIYICVPFVERKDWRFLWDADLPQIVAPPNPFHDNDVHITHFSIDGLKRMGLGLGARECEFWTCQDVYDKSPGSFEGVLFRF